MISYNDMTLMKMATGSYTTELLFRIAGKYMALWIVPWNGSQANFGFMPASPNSQPTALCMWLLSQNWKRTKWLLVVKPCTYVHHGCGCCILLCIGKVALFLCRACKTGKQSNCKLLLPIFQVAVSAFSRFPEASGTYSALHWNVLMMLGMHNLCLGLLYVDALLFAECLCSLYLRARRSCS